MSVIKDMDKFVRMKAAMAMEKAAASGGEAGAGLGLGLGMMMPAMFANVQPSGTQPVTEAGGAEVRCSDCGMMIPARLAKICITAPVSARTSAISICP